MKDKVLSIEQMRELINMGIDTSNASLYWYGTDEAEFVCFGTDIDKDWGDEICPTFTLQDIYDILPSIIFGDKGEVYELAIKKWGIRYKGIHRNVLKSFVFPIDNKEIMDAAFRMLKWCKENNYI